jgi:membrane-associated phospholipid phosphatase
MQDTTHPQGQGLRAQPQPRAKRAGNEGDAPRTRARVSFALWIAGLLLLIASCFVIHAHPAPYPTDLMATHTVQGWSLSGWLLALIVLPSVVNDPIFSETALGVWVAGLLIVSLVRWRLKLPALGWLLAAVFLAATVSASAGLNVLLDEVVGRPRPNPRLYHIQLHTSLVPFPTYPSGHVEHDVAYYGFLLFLSFTKPVRQWRYRWILIPFQLYAAFDLLIIGLSRIYEGDHWFTDVLGGYLEGAVYLVFFIFLYLLVSTWFARRRQRKMQGVHAATL